MIKAWPLVSKPHTLCLSSLSCQSKWHTVVLLPSQTSCPASTPQRCLGTRTRWWRPSRRRGAWGSRSRGSSSTTSSSSSQDTTVWRPNCQLWAAWASTTATRLEGQTDHVWLHRKMHRHTWLIRSMRITWSKCSFQRHFLSCEERILIEMLMGLHAHIHKNYTNGRIYMIYSACDTHQQAGTKYLLRYNF